MGLDWQPLGKPKPGHEAEFDKLYKKIFHALRDPKRLWEKLRAIEVSPPMRPCGRHASDSMLMPTGGRQENIRGVPWSGNPSLGTSGQRCSTDTASSTWCR